MHRNKVSIIASTKLGALRALVLLLSILPKPPLLHILDVRLEWIGLFLNLTTANLWEHEPAEFVNVTMGCVDFATILAGKVLFRLSVLNSLSTHNCAINHHIFVDVALP